MTVFMQKYAHLEIEHGISWTLSPSPYKTVLFFLNRSSLLGWIYDMCSFSTWFIQIYFILLFIFEVTQWIKDWNSATLATLLKALVLLYTFDFIKPWFISLEITLSNAVSLFYALQISSNIILNARLSNGYPSLVALPL